MIEARSGAPGSGMSFLEEPDFQESVELVEKLSPEVQHLLMLLAIRLAGQFLRRFNLSAVAPVSRVPSSRPFYRRGRW